MIISRVAKEDVSDYVAVGANWSDVPDPTPGVYNYDGLGAEVFEKEWNEEKLDAEFRGEIKKWTPPCDGFLQVLDASAGYFSEDFSGCTIQARVESDEGFTNVGKVLDDTCETLRKIFLRNTGVSSFDFLVWIELRSDETGDYLEAFFSGRNFIRITDLFRPRYRVLGSSAKPTEGSSFDPKKFRDLSFDADSLYQLLSAVSMDDSKLEFSCDHILVGARTSANGSFTWYTNGKLENEPVDVRTEFIRALNEAIKKEGYTSPFDVSFVIRGGYGYGIYSYRVHFDGKQLTISDFYGSL